MNVRHFTRASSDYIQCSIGALDNTRFGPITVASLVKKSSDPATHAFMLYGGNDADPDNWIFYIEPTTNKLGVWTGTVDIVSSFTVTAAEGWVMLAATKATGTVGVIFHKFVLSTRTWTHETITAATSANSGLIHTFNTHGASNAHSGNFWDGHILANAVWTSVLNSAALEAIGPDQYADFSALCTGWLATSPAAMWRLDQAAVTTAVNDQTAGGANQTSRSGTSVVTNDDPPFGSGSSADYTVVNTKVSQLANVNAGGTDIDARSYKSGVTLTDTELAALASTQGAFVTKTGAISEQMARLLKNVVRRRSS